MSPLAAAIYNLLRQRTGLTDPRITYAALAALLRDSATEFSEVHHRNRELYAALGQVGEHCRRHGLPSLPALVVRSDTGRPGAAYFDGHVPGTVGWGERVATWREELERVKGARYPAR